jgi:integrase
VVGDFPLDRYRREHANKVRDFLLGKGNRTATVRRRLNAIKAVFNKALLEFDLQGKSNPFNKVDIPGEGKDSERRESFTQDELASIRSACLKSDNDIRHIVAIQVETGARLGEVVGLRIEDVVLDAEVPHIHIRPHERLGRTLKTAASERDVPLLGVSLWGAKRALEGVKQRGKGQGWLFPRYAADNSIRGTSAANTIDMWLKRLTGTKKTSHCFRHAMRTRLRHQEVPEEIQDAIGGWGKRTIGRSYGEPALLRQLKAHLEKVVPALG